MKGSYIALAVLAAIILTVVLAPIALDSALSDISAPLKGNAPTAQMAESAREGFDKNRPLLSLLLSDTAVWQIEECIIDLQSAINSADKNAAEGAKNRLCGLITEHRRLSGFSIYSIF